MSLMTERLSRIVSVVAGGMLVFACINAPASNPTIEGDLLIENVRSISFEAESPLIVAAGISPYRALRMATYNPSRVMKELDRGCLKSGCVADLALYACDPLKGLDCLKRPEAVVQVGRYHDADALSLMLKSAEIHNVDRTETNLFAGLEAKGAQLDQFNQ